DAYIDPLVTINLHGKITDLNKALASITGWTCEKIRNTDFRDYFAEPQKAQAVIQEVFDNEIVTDSHLTLSSKNGKFTDVLFNGSVFKDEHGTVQGAVIVIRDIIGQKWAIELRKAFE